MKYYLIKGSTQADVPAMAMYAVGTKPLLNKLTDVVDIIIIVHMPNSGVPQFRGGSLASTQNTLLSCPLEIAHVKAQCLFAG